MRRVIPRLVIVLTLAVVGGSLLLFLFFLLFGTPWPIDLARSDTTRLLWDSLLCMVFFLQHSGMIRRSAKQRMAKHVPAIYQPALYSIASGLALFALILLWQLTDQYLFHLHGPARWFSGCVALAAIAGFFWGIRALDHFDPFGTLPITAAKGIPQQGLRAGVPRTKGRVGTCPVREDDPAIHEHIALPLLTPQSWHGATFNCQHRQH
jgi:hypothetical protein